jgi:hypothetical protein
LLPATESGALGGSVVLVMWSDSRMPITMMNASPTSSPIFVSRVMAKS